jgi:uncharacterized protein (TIGR00661 family)
MHIDVCLSGNMSQIDVSDLNVKYKFDGLTLDLDDGKVSLIGTVKKLKLFSLIKSARSIDVNNYDILVSDFEPVLCWAGLIRRKRVLGISSQTALEYVDGQWSIYKYHQ